jgi:uncharacterized repeat protein (TIGR04042 family)
MHFRVRWPDASETRCYSPSLVIQDFFEPGRSYVLGDFLGRSRHALSIASERVRAKYGRPCSLALGQLAEIERLAGRFEAGAQVRIIDFD